MVYTSYFANWRALEKANIQIVSIARINPHKLVCPMLKHLAPSAALLAGVKKGTVNWERYTEQYKKQLAKINITEINEKLAELQEQYGEIALCCYEKPMDNCHRHLLAEFLNEKLSMSISEYRG